MMPSAVKQEHANLKGTDQLSAAPFSGPRLESVSTQPKILPREVPLSFAQERLWFLEQINPGDASGTISRAIKITGLLKQDLIRQALQTVIDRHDSLRT